jgi:hypothetical protein
MNRSATQTGRTADQVALDLLANSVEHDEGFRGEIEKGRLAASERHHLTINRLVLA